jgi:hypothetical protein
MLGLPISNLVVLSSMMFAGLVHTKNKKGIFIISFIHLFIPFLKWKFLFPSFIILLSGIAIFDLPSTESDSDTIVHPRTFKEYNTK